MKTNLEMKECTKVFINGELFLINYKVTIQDYLYFLGISDTQISSNIFECNNKIISKKSLKTTKLEDLTKLELVQVVGGG